MNSHEEKMRLPTIPKRDPALIFAFKNDGHIQSKLKAGRAAAAIATALGLAFLYASGRCIIKAVSSGELVTDRPPLCNSTIRLTIARPMPFPSVNERYPPGRIY